MQKEKLLQEYYKVKKELLKRKKGDISVTIRNKEVTFWLHDDEVEYLYTDAKEEVGNISQFRKVKNVRKEYIKAFLTKANKILNK